MTDKQSAFCLSVLLASGIYTTSYCSIDLRSLFVHNGVTGRWRTNMSAGLPELLLLSVCTSETVRCRIDHPLQRDVREPRLILRIATADVGMVAREPELFKAVYLRAFDDR